MPALDLNLNNIPDEVVADPGEHQFRIGSAEVKENVNGKQFISVGFESTTQPDADWVFEQYYLPNGSQSQKGQDFLRRNIKKLTDAFDVPVAKNGSLDVDTIVGCEGYATVRHEEDDKGQLRAKIGVLSTGK